MAELKVFTGPFLLTQVWCIWYIINVCMCAGMFSTGTGPVKTSRLSYNYHRQTATSLNLGWYLVRLGWGESWKLIGWCFGAPWAATGSLLHQFESSSTSAERKQQTNCWTTNKQTNKQTNSVYSLTVQCWYSTSCQLRVRVKIKVKKSFRWIKWKQSYYWLLKRGSLKSEGFILLKAGMRSDILGWFKQICGPNCWTDWHLGLREENATSLWITLVKNMEK